VLIDHANTARDSRFRHAPEKIFFREGTPELASPCRYSVGAPTALAPHGAIVKPNFNGNRRKQ
jgi:hypothetical protein